MQDIFLADVKVASDEYKRVAGSWVTNALIHPIRVPNGPSKTGLNQLS